MVRLNWLTYIIKPIQMFHLNHTIKMILIIHVHKSTLKCPFKGNFRSVSRYVKDCRMLYKKPNRAESIFPFFTVTFLSWLAAFFCFDGWAKNLSRRFHILSMCVVALNGFLDNSSERNQKIVTIFNALTHTWLPKFTIHNFIDKLWKMDNAPVVLLIWFHCSPETIRKL